MESETFKRIRMNEEVFVMIARYDRNEGFKEILATGDVAIFIETDSYEETELVAFDPLHSVEWDKEFFRATPDYPGAVVNFCSNDGHYAAIVTHDKDEFDKLIPHLIAKNPELEPELKTALSN